MVSIQKRSKGLSGSVLAAFVAAVLLLAGSSVSANSGNQQLLAEGGNKNKVEQSGTMGSSQQGFESDPFGGGPVSDKIQDYATFVQDESVEYTTKGLHEFAKAAGTLIEKGEGEQALKDRHKELENSAKKIKDEKDPQTQAQLASQAFKDASMLLSDIQQRNHPQASQVSQQVQAAAEKITADKRLDMQLGEVQDFFIESGRALNQLSSGGEGIGGGPMEDESQPVTPETSTPPAVPSEPAEPLTPEDPTGGGPTDGTAPPAY